MKAFCIALVGCLTLALVGPASNGGDDKTPDKTKLVGFWEVVKSDEVPLGSIVQFTKDGKLILTFKEEGETKKLQATYKIEGNRLLITRKNEGKEEVDNLTIKTLTATTLVTLSEKGKTDELKKKEKK